MRGRPRSLFNALVALLVVGVVFAGCSSKSSKNGGTPRRGGTLDVSIRDLGSLDPAKASGPGALLVVSQVFDSLTSIDPTSNAVAPAAAASWTTSADGLTWRFTLKQATFQNGKKVTARDFKFAFDRVVQKSLKSGIAYELGPVTGFAAARIAGEAKTLSGVTAPRDDTLVIHVDRPYYELPYNLADPGLAPIIAGTTKGLDTSPVGNGPFKVVNATAESQAILARYDGYTGQAAYLDGVKFHVVSNNDDAWRAYQSGQTDITDVPAAQAAGAKGADQRGFTPSWATLSFGPNLKLAKYKDANVRLAISMAIDRQAIAMQIYGGTRDPATGLVPRGVRGFVPDLCGDSCGFHQDRARTLLQAKFKSSFPSITIDLLSDETSRLVAQEIAKDLRAVGFKTKLHAHDPAGYLTLLQKHGQDFAELGWVSNVPSPDGFLAQQLLGHSANNQTAFALAAFDAEIARARNAKDDTTRLADYQGAERHALSVMPLIPIVFYRNKEAVASRVHGFQLDGAGIFDASKIWLS